MVKEGNGGQRREWWSKGRLVLGLILIHAQKMPFRGQVVSHKRTSKQPVQGSQGCWVSPLLQKRGEAQRPRLTYKQSSKGR